MTGDLLGKCGTRNNWGPLDKGFTFSHDPRYRGAVFKDRCGFSHVIYIYIYIDR